MSGTENCQTLTSLSGEEVLLLASRGDRDASEEALRRNNGLIWSIARRYFGRGVEPDDLYQLGCVGFLKAVAGFDPAFGTRFSTYAVPKIAGEIRRFLRDDGSVKVSRGMKELAQQIRYVRGELAQQLQREPTVSEIAEKLAVSPEEVAACETATAPTESLQQESGEDGFTLERVLGTEEPEERMVEAVALRDAMDRLGEQERQVIDLRFFHGLTQQAVGRMLCISQVQVSRLERRSLTALRHMLGDD